MIKNKPRRALEKKNGGNFPVDFNIFSHAQKRHKEAFFGLSRQLSNERRLKKDSFHIYTNNCMIKTKPRRALVKLVIFLKKRQNMHFLKVLAWAYF